MDWYIAGRLGVIFDTTSAKHLKLKTIRKC